MNEKEKKERDRKKKTAFFFDFLTTRNEKKKKLFFPFSNIVLLLPGLPHVPEAQKLGDIVRGTCEEGRPRMQGLGTDVEHARGFPVSRSSPRGDGDRRERRRLVDATQVGPRVARPPAIEQSTVQVGHQRTHVPCRVLFFGFSLT